MACNNSLKRRMLLSIIRAPTLTRQHIHSQSLVQTRAIHATRWSQNQGFSISFGPEIDGLLNPTKKSTGTTSSENPRSKKRTSKPSPSVTNISNSDTTPPEENAVYTNSEIESRSSKGTPNFTLQAESAARSHSLAKHGGSSSDEPTIQLSEDAYDTISRPETTYRGPSNPPLDSKPASKRLKKNERTREAVNQQVKVAAIAPQPRKRSEQWQIQKDALQKKFGEDGWNPRKKMSPDAMEGIRSLHEQDPERYSTPVLAQQFKMSPEAIRRILKSKWRPSTEDMEKRRERWARRHDRIWDQKAALGLRPARRTIREPEGPEAFEEELRAKQALGQV